jgi:hypothetical protein
LNRTRYTHNKRFQHSFENLRLSLEKLREDNIYDQVRVNALFALYQNLKSIDAQLQNLETERDLQLINAQQTEHQLKDDDLKGWNDIFVRVNSISHLNLFYFDTRSVYLSFYLLAIFLFKLPILHMDTGFYSLHCSYVSQTSTPQNAAYICV